MRGGRWGMNDGSNMGAAIRAASDGMKGYFRRRLGSQAASPRNATWVFGASASVRLYVTIVTGTSRQSLLLRHIGAVSR